MTQIFTATLMYNEHDELIGLYTEKGLVVPSDGKINTFEELLDLLDIEVNCMKVNTIMSKNGRQLPDNYYKIKEKDIIKRWEPSRNEQ